VEISWTHAYLVIMKDIVCFASKDAMGYIKEGINKPFGDNKDLHDLIIKHYQRPEVKKTILRYCQTGDEWRALNRDFSDWYDKDQKSQTAKLIHPSRYDHLLLMNDTYIRSLYATLNVFEPELKDKTQPLIQDENRLPGLGGFEETLAYTPGVDIDSIKDKVHGLDITTSPEMKEAVESAGQFFVDWLMEKGIRSSVHVLYSGGGIYVYVHHALCRADPAWTREERVEYFTRVTDGFNAIISAISDDFFNVHPEYTGKVKFDAGLNRKRVHKTIFSVHKRLPFAVIPLNREHVKIDFDQAMLPLSDEVLQMGRHWYEEFDLEEKAALEKLIDDYHQLKIIKSSSSKLSQWSEVISPEHWCPCMKKIWVEEWTGEGRHRALGIFSAFLYQAGYDEETARNMAQQVADRHRISERMDIFSAWYGKMNAPLCRTLQEETNCYPEAGLGGLGYCDESDEICKIVDRPMNYAITHAFCLMGGPLVDLVERAKGDAGVLLQSDVVQAFAELQTFAPSKALSLYDQLKKARVTGLKDFKESISNYQLQRASTAEDDERDGSYVVKDHQLCRVDIRTIKDNQIKIYKPICNFEAYIRDEISIDDGAIVTKSFRIEGRSDDGSNLPSVQVSASDFDTMKWILPAWGARANIFPRMKEEVKSAIQSVSIRGMKTKKAYGHLGWRQIDGEWYYIHAGGAIGRNGPVEGIGVQLSVPSFRDYLLPEVAADEVVEANRASLKLLEVADHSISLRLAAVVSLAPLTEIIPATFSEYIVGESGSLKTQLTALQQAHFGAAWSGRPTHLPTGWRSTLNALERLAFVAKDAIMVVDDFAPSSSRGEKMKMDQKAASLLRGQANKDARTRMNADTSIKQSYEPRCMVITSGEDLPPGQSIAPRMLIINLNKGDVDVEKLTELQALSSQGWLAKSMAAYIQWIAEHFEELQSELPVRVEFYMKEFGSEMRGIHLRSPEQAAILITAWDTRLRFMVESGTLTQDQATDLLAGFYLAMLNTAEEQASVQVDEDPCERFIELLKTAFSMGQAHLADSVNDDDKPIDPDRWGWIKKGTVIEADGQKKEYWQARGARIGWVDKMGIYLEPGSAYLICQDIAGGQGQPIAFREKTLWKRLKSKGYSIAKEKGKNQDKVKIMGRWMRVIHILHEAWNGDEEKVDYCILEGSYEERAEMVVP